MYGQRIAKSEYEWNEDNNPVLNTNIDYDKCFDDTKSNNGYQKVDGRDKYKVEIKAARVEAKKTGAVALKGSSKQKSWALQIRQTATDKITDASLKKFALNNIPSSKFWIDNRNNAKLIAIITEAYDLCAQLPALKKELEDLIPPGLRGQLFDITPEIRILMDKQNIIVRKVDELLL